MAQNGISTETVHIGTSTVVDPIATKIKRRNDKLALAQETRSSTIYGYRKYHRITGSHLADVNGHTGTFITSLSGTASPAIGHPWSLTPAQDIVIQLAVELDTTPSTQVAGVTYVDGAVTFVPGGFATDPTQGSTAFYLTNFSTSTSHALNTMLGTVSVGTPTHVGFYNAAWSTGSSQPLTFVYLVHSFGTGNVGNADGTSLYFEVTDADGNDIAGNWIFPVTLTLITQLS